MRVFSGLDHASACFSVDFVASQMSGSCWCSVSSGPDGLVSVTEGESRKNS